MKPRTRSIAAAIRKRLEMLLKGALLASTICLVVGLALWVVQGDSDGDTALLKAGLVLLMSTPVMRVAISAGEALRARDWIHLGTIATVAALFGLTMAFALSRL